MRTETSHDEPSAANAKNTPGRYFSPGSAKTGQERLLLAARRWWVAARWERWQRIYWCGAGLGRLRIIDRDFVEPSNLQRQTLFEEAGRARSAAQSDRGGTAFARDQFRCAWWKEWWPI